MSDGNKYKIIGNNPCSNIRDCSSALSKTYSLKDIESLKETDRAPECYKNLSYNAMSLEYKNKVLIITTREIPIGEEIFYEYGWYYIFPYIY